VFLDVRTDRRRRLARCRQQGLSECLLGSEDCDALNVGQAGRTRLVELRRTGADRTSAISYLLAKGGVQGPGFFSCYIRRPEERADTNMNTSLRCLLENEPARCQ